MVEVFKTNVQTVDQATVVMFHLKREFPDFQIDFDLEDCDNILRIETVTHFMDIETILRTLKNCGLHAEILPDI